MKQSWIIEAERMLVLKAAEGEAVKTVCAGHNISEATYYHWKNKYGGMAVGEARRLRGLEEENARLKRGVADQAVQIEMPKEVNSKKWQVRRAEDGRRKGGGQTACATRPRLRGL